MITPWYNDFITITDPWIHYPFPLFAEDVGQYWYFSLVLFFQKETCRSLVNTRRENFPFVEPTESVRANTSRAALFFFNAKQRLNSIHNGVILFLFDKQIQYRTNFHNYYNDTLWLIYIKNGVRYISLWK